jgi:TonB family protein
MITWQQWEGRIINGRFPLREYLGGSKQSAVFLTEINGSKAAIKLIPSDATGADVRVSRWQSAGKLSHPHLLRIFDTGYWRAEDEQEMLFAVMEYADENLAQVLPDRRLTPAEASQMLRPTLDVLGYLHGQGMVHGSIKPANFMAVSDELKLSSDGIRPVGNAEESSEGASVYDAPERAQGAISPSGDVWSLGTVLVEALTNRLPTGERTDENDPELPDNIPQPFEDIAKHCLTSDPGRRWSTTEIRKRLDRTPVETTEDVATQETSAVPEGHEMYAPVAERNASSLHEGEAIVERTGSASKLRGVRLALTIAIILAVIAAAARLLHRNSENPHPASTPPPRQSAESAMPPTTSENLSVSKTNNRAADHGVVAHEVLPDVPLSARNTITGTVRVTVKVAVDASGAVSHASLASAGPSKYFADQALQAARKWTFTPPTVDGRTVPSEWSLRFEFKRNGTTAAAQRTTTGS